MNSVKNYNGSGVREEAFNTKLADVLSKSGILYIPESIFRKLKHRRLPDIFAQYWGIRVVLEARFVKNKQEKKKLENDCLKRIEDGLAVIAVGIIYPMDLRFADWESVENAIRHSKLLIRMFSENGSGEWFTSDLRGLSEMLRICYESLVNEDVVNTTVDELKQSIEMVSMDLSSSAGTDGRLKELLVLPYEQRKLDDET